MTHPERQAIKGTTAGKPSGTRVGHKSPAIRHGDLIFVSGQVGVDKEGNMPRTIEEQTRNIWASIDKILQQAGSSVQHVVQTTTFMTDLSNVWAIDDVKLELFPEDPPTNAAIGVRELPYGADVEIQSIAIVPSASDEG